MNFFRICYHSMSILGAIAWCYLSWIRLGRVAVGRLISRAIRPWIHHRLTGISCGKSCIGCRSSRWCATLTSHLNRSVGNHTCKVCCISSQLTTTSKRNGIIQRHDVRPFLFLLPTCLFQFTKNISKLHLCYLQFIGNKRKEK